MYLQLIQIYNIMYLQFFFIIYFFMASITLNNGHFQIVNKMSVTESVRYLEL